MKESETPSERKEADAVNHPKHYTDHPSGIECIQITQHMNFCLGNAVKYIWRADLKMDAIEDLKKARRYIDYEIERRERQRAHREPYHVPSFRKMVRRFIHSMAMNFRPQTL